MDATWRTIWRRFKQGKSAMFGFMVVCLATVIALFGYALAPDKTPNCDNQMPQINAKPPFFKAKILKINLGLDVPPTNWFLLPFFGQPTPYKWLPFEHYAFAGDSLRVKIEGGVQQTYHIASVVFSLSPDVAIQKKANDVFELSLSSGKNVRISKSELQNIIKKEYITERRFLLGTDMYGRDIFSRLLLGTRVSLAVGFIAVCISLSIGLLLGALAGYFGGRIDSFIMLFVNTIWSIPTLLLVFAVVLALGRWNGTLFLAVGLTIWVDVARMVRGQVMALKAQEFVEAAKSLGFSHFRRLFVHIVPNLLGPLMVLGAANFASAILLEAGLGYLGFGIQPPMPSWGGMLNENYGYALGGKPFMAFAPAFTIMLLVLAFNLVGNGLRDALDVRDDNQHKKD